MPVVAFRSTRLLLAPVTAVALGCGAQDDLRDGGGEEATEAVGKADEADSAPLSPENAAQALTALADSMVSVAVTLGEQEDAIGAVTAAFPIADVELRGDKILAGFADRIDLLAEDLLLDLPNLLDAVTHEVAIPGATLCGAISLDKQARGQCTALADAAGLRLRIEGAGDVFTFEVRHGPQGRTPLAFALDTRDDALRVDMRISLPDSAPIFALFETILGADLGALTDEEPLQGELTASFAKTSDVVSVDMQLPEPLAFSTEYAAISVESRDGAPLLDLALESDARTELRVAIGGVAVSAVAGQFTDSEVLDEIVTLDWGGVDVVATATADGVTFRGVHDPFLAATHDPGEPATVLLASEVVTEPIEGALDPDGKVPVPGPNLRGLATTYATGLQTVATNLDLTATETVSVGGTLVDVSGSFRARNTARLKLAAQGELSKIGSIKCAVNGTYTIEVDGGETLVVSEDAKDACVVGYYTRGDGGKPLYHYATAL